MVNKSIKSRFCATRRRMACGTWVLFLFVCLRIAAAAVGCGCGGVGVQPLQRHNELLASLEIGTLELWTTLGEWPIGIGRQLLTAGHFHVGAGFNVDCLCLYVTCHNCAYALRLVLLVGQHSTTGDFIKALAMMRRMEGSRLCEYRSIGFTYAADSNHSNNED